MTSISAVVVTLNEEENIADCLSTLTWCDQIILVDNDSEDSTINEAEKFTDEIYIHEERHGYGDPLKKTGVKKASGDWILLLDADERITPVLAEKFIEYAEKGEYDIIYTPHKNYIFGEWIKNAGWWPDYHARFFRRGHVKIDPEVHNFLNESQKSRKKRLDPTAENAIIHFNYTDIHSFVHRLNRYTNVEAEEEGFSITSLLFRPFGEFILRFFVRTGFKSGLRGLTISLLMLWYRLVSQLKAYEDANWGGKEEYIDKYDKINESILSNWEDTDLTDTDRGQNHE